MQVCAFDHQCYTGNSFIFKNYLVEDAQCMSDGKILQVPKCLQPFNLTLSPFSLKCQVLLHFLEVPGEELQLQTFVASQKSAQE